MITNLESDNMQLIIEDRVYDLVEITCPIYAIHRMGPDIYDFTYIEYEKFPNMDFDNFHYSAYEVTKYRAILINGKYYAPKLVEQC